MKLRLSDLDMQILREFWQDAHGGDGWLRHGVRGWRHRGEVAHRVRDDLASDAIISLRKAGLITVTTIQVGPRQHLYRISPEGAQRVVPGQELKLPERTPGRETYFIRYIHWFILVVFRGALTDRSVPVRARQRGWLSASELRRRAGGYSGASYCTEALAKIGLVKQMRVPGELTRYSRVTPAGLRLRIVERQWIGEEGMEQIEVGDVGKLDGIAMLRE